MILSTGRKVYVAGHGGLVGSALVRSLQDRGHQSIITASRAEVDLRESAPTRAFLEKLRPDIVIVAAAKVGGIKANNTFPADFIHDNLAIATNLIHGSFLAGVPRLLFLASSCIYPKHAPQPMSEDDLLTGPLEPTNAPYAVAKIAGITMCESYRRQHGVVYHSVLPANLYGPGDNYHLENAHVVPGLLRRFHEARVRGDSEVVIWGTGSPRREFLYVDDAAAACLHVLGLDSPPDCLNVGTGVDVTIKELATMVKDVTGFQGSITHDAAQPDGAPRKLLDVSRLKALGWTSAVPLDDGLRRTYEAYLHELNSSTARH